MKHWPVAFGLLAVGTPAAAEPSKVRGFAVMETGIYTRDIISSERDSNGVVRNVISNPQLVAGTTRIPAKLGVSFGFRFMVSGAPTDAKVTVRKETRYPAPGARPPGSASPLAVSSVSTDVPLNRVRFTGYTLAEPWELVPGKWVISVWFGDRKLGEQQFTVVKE
jgi:hypothetical protein